MSETPNMPPIIPYLTVKGAADAIAFYVKAFGAVENTRMAAEDGKRVMHADLTINGGRVMLSDEFPDFGGPGAPDPNHLIGAAVAMSIPKAADVDAIFRRAVDAGCTATMEPHDAFFGRFAMLSDPFGHRWMLAGPPPAQG